MKIHLEGQYKYILFKEFTDDYGVSNMDSYQLFSDSDVYIRL